MTPHQTRLYAFIEEEVSKVRGIALPVRAGKLERALVRKVRCKKLHPNPEDEFCQPDIGPNEEIISRYELEYRRILTDPSYADLAKSGVEEPLEVQKIEPDGYMILNGHHRWAAAVRTGIETLPVRIVNLMSEEDIRQALKNSKHDRRLVLDLEEVVYAPDGNGGTEKPLRFPHSLFYKEQLRLGIPVLFNTCATRGFDVWLYSSGYESVDFVSELLKLYHTQITGIISGTARNAPKHVEARERTEQLMAGKYTRTIHADNSAVIDIDSRTKQYREYPLEGAAWSAQVLECLGTLEKEG